MMASGNRASIIAFTTSFGFIHRRGDKRIISKMLYRPLWSGGWTLLTVVLLLFGQLTDSLVLTPGQTASGNDPERWNRDARNTLKSILNSRRNENVAKNIIFFLGDGMSIPTVTATRILYGQKQGKTGEETILNMEKFPDVALMKTYNVDMQVPDSAATATAYLCGVKANYETVGVNERATLGKCETLHGNEVSSILEWAMEAGKRTGFITTARVTHASPAGLYAKSVSRYWESDDEKPSNTTACKDIALQLIEDKPGRNINLIMGGGRRHFLPNNMIDPINGKSGQRRDKRNLVNDFIEDKILRNLTYRVMATNKQFQEWDVKEADHILALFDSSHMQYEVDRDNGPRGQPHIAEMTVKAIEMLSQEPKGYFLFVEGGRIDHAHHETHVVRALEDTIAMDKAIKAAIDVTNENDTLIIVTADHAHVMTINGYPKRGNPIFGIADISDIDKLPYTTLMYTNGIGYTFTPTGRPNISGIDTAHKDYTPLTAVPKKDETHGGDDVAIYARGPMSYLFNGVQEQNYIPHALAYAACIGYDKSHCNEVKSKYERSETKVKYETTHSFNGNAKLSSSLLGYFVILFQIVFVISKH